MVGVGPLCLIGHLRIDGLLCLDGHLGIIGPLGLDGQMYIKQRIWENVLPRVLYDNSSDHRRERSGVLVFAGAYAYFYSGSG